MEFFFGGEAGAFGWENFIEVDIVGHMHFASEVVSEHVEFTVEGADGRGEIADCMRLGIGDARRKAIKQRCEVCAQGLLDTHGRRMPDSGEVLIRRYQSLNRHSPLPLPILMRVRLRHNR